MEGTIAMLPTTSPQSAGLSASRLQQAFSLLQGWLNENIVTAIACVVARHGKIVGEFYGGRVTPSADAPAASATTLFHIASIGKPMTCTAVMMLVEEGRLSLDDKVGDILPNFKGEWRDAITVKHLLTHTSGLPQDPGPEILEGLPEGADTPTQLANYHKTNLAVPVGSKVEYSNVGFGLLGLIIEAVGGRPFPAFMRERIFAPIGMSDAYLAPPVELYPRIAHVNGTPNAGSTYERFNSAYARTLTHPAGSIVATARDVAAFFQMFLDEGKVGYQAIIAPATAQLMTMNHTHGLRGGIEGFMTWENCSWGLGFDLRTDKQPHFSGEFTSPRTFGHSGVAGTFAWADPTRQLVCVMLANRLLHSLWNFPRWSRFSTASVSSVVE
jgi:beta-lactamase class C